MISSILRVVDQWSYHSLYTVTAEFVSRTEGFQIVELNSFGCGLDSIVADQVKDILSANHKIHTLLKIDEGTNLGGRYDSSALLAICNGNVACVVIITQRHRKKWW